MVVLGALMIIVAHLLNSWGILQRNDIEAPNEYQMSIVEHKREDLKRNRKIYWRPNVAHMTRDLAPVGAGIRRASGQAWQRARRFSVAWEHNIDSSAGLILTPNQREARERQTTIEFIFLLILTYFMYKLV